MTHLEEVRTCSRCNTAKSVERCFYTNRAKSQSWCIDCHRGVCRAAARTNPERKAQMKNAARKWHSDEHNREWRKWRHIFNTYKLTMDQYYAIEERQNFQCAICPAVGQLHVDHNHETGEIRGLLCGQCNMGLGNFHDNADRLEAARRYLAERGSYHRYSAQQSYAKRVTRLEEA